MMWFASSSPRDKLTEARGAYDDFITGFDAADQQRKAAACAEVIWHLRDWLYHRSDNNLKVAYGWNSKADFVAWIEAQPEYPDIRRCRDLANGSKHAVLTQPPNPVYTETTASATSPAVPLAAFSAAAPGSPRFVLGDGTVLKAIGSGGARRDDIEPILRAALNAWDSIFGRLGL